MHLRLRIGALIAILALAALPLLARTKIVHRWVLTGAPMPRFQKMLVASVGDDYLIRQEFEDEMKRLLARYAVEGVQSYLVLPPRNEMMERELRQRIKESSIDSVLVVRAISLRGETQEVAKKGDYAPPPGYSTLWPFWNLAYGELYPSSSFLQENPFVRVEFNLYSTKEEKLVWNGETDPLNSKDFERLGGEYAQTLVTQLKKDKILGKK